MSAPVPVVKLSASVEAASPCCGIPHTYTLALTARGWKLVGAPCPAGECEVREHVTTALEAQLVAAVEAAERMASSSASVGGAGASGGDGEASVTSFPGADVRFDLPRGYPAASDLGFPEIGFMGERC